MCCLWFMTHYPFTFTLRDHLHDRIAHRMNQTFSRREAACDVLQAPTLVDHAGKSSYFPR